MGVQMDSKLSFQAHHDDFFIDEKIATANKVLGMLRRTFTHMDTHMLCWLFWH
jgi:hypothetical protein